MEKGDMVGIVIMVPGPLCFMDGIVEIGMVNMVLATRWTLLPEANEKILLYLSVHHIGDVQTDTTRKDIKLAQ